MPTYPDRRPIYAGRFAGDFPPGTPRHDNPTKQEVKAPKIAYRDGTAPRDKFRVTTTPLPEPLPAPDPKPFIEPVPDSREIDSIYGDKPGTLSEDVSADENEI
jgi:hypothetical protein